jgi:selenium metabolism protein YedF
MDKTLDLRGLVCPEPVLRAKKLLDDISVVKLEALVESEVNVNNLERLARSMQLQFDARQENECFRVTIRRTTIASDSKTAPKAMERAFAAKGKNGASSAPVGEVVLLARDKFGDGDPDFSNNLMNVFLQTLLQSGHRPRAILMANTGVKLLDPGSSTFKVLEDFKAEGVEVLACGLCVEYYGLKEKIPVEQITNMFAICEFIMSADKVVQP